MPKFNTVVGRSAKIIGWSFAALTAVVLFFLFVAVPFLLPMAVERIGSERLSHTMTLRRAFLDPVHSRFSLSQFSIKDSDHTEMFGFDKFWIDMDVLKLFHRRYLVRSVGFDGLRVNAVLLPGNLLNLSSLKPRPTAQATPVPAGKSAMPDVVVDEFIVRNGSVTFTDRSFGPGFTLRLEPVDLRVKGMSTRSGDTVQLVLKSEVDGQGTLVVDATAKPLQVPPAVEASVSLSKYAVRALTPYVGKYTGRGVKEGGQLDLLAAYRLQDNQLEAKHRFLIQDFDFGEKFETKDALNMPFDLALALLKDSNGRIDLDLPVKGDVTNPKFEYFHVLGKVGEDLFMKIVFAPFNLLTSIVPGAGGTVKKMDIGTISYPPGASTLTRTEKRNLLRLAILMRQQPKDHIEINGGYDPGVDGKVGQAGTTVTSNEKLTALARARGQAVMDALIAAGIDRSRLSQGDVHATMAAAGNVPTDFSIGK